MKHFIRFIIFLCIVILIPATLFGIVPGLSRVLGFGPKNLGINITKADAEAAQNKDGTVIVALPANTPLTDDFRLEGKRDVDITFDSKELTAHSNYRSWKNYPVRDVQIKIHEDGTIESSAILVIAKAMPYAMGLGYSQEQIESAMKKYSIPPFEVPLYILGRGSVTNDKVTVNAESVKIGAIPIPESIVQQANAEAESVLNDIIRKHSHAFHAEEVSFTNGKMHFKGQLPVKEYVITE